MLGKWVLEAAGALWSWADWWVPIIPHYLISVHLFSKQMQLDLPQVLVTSCKLISSSWDQHLTQRSHSVPSGPVALVEQILRPGSKYQGSCRKVRLAV